MKKIEVAAAIIMFEDQFLCVQRAKHKLPYISEKYEFPGGKIENGETREQALHREITEELKTNVDIIDFFLTVEHTYPDFELTMHSYICTVQSQEIILNEHIDAKWLSIDKLKDLNWAAADIPIVKKLMENDRRNI